MSNSLEVLQFALALLVILSLAVLVLYAAVAAAVLLLGSLGRHRSYLAKELDCFLKDFFSPVSRHR
jgi:hypothetical protein